MHLQSRACRTLGISSVVLADAVSSKSVCRSVLCILQDFVFSLNVLQAGGHTPIPASMCDRLFHRHSEVQIHTLSIGWTHTHIFKCLVHARHAREVGG